jgi:hypothetical protein
MEEEKKVTLVVTQKQLEVIFAGILEIPAKYSLSIIQDLQKQVQGQIDEPKENEVTTE